METTLENLLMALGEQAVENFMLRRKADELQQEVTRQAKRIMELEEPVPIKSPDEVAS